MSVATSIRGFPEWLPEGQLVERHVLARLRDTFELHGYLPLETRSVESTETLLQKGETDKEIYLLRRLQAAEGEGDSGLGLHFDLTVPFARYVSENAGRLAFPFRRYQIQKAWRGERPQEGRYREFLQADVDVVAVQDLPGHFEVELPLVAAEALGRLPIPAVTIGVNNRKVMEGFLQGVGFTGDRTVALRALDKLHRSGPSAVAEDLRALGARPEQVDACLALAAIRSDDESFIARVRELRVSHPLLDEGLSELASVLAGARAAGEARLRADLSITRGLDYYTGTVYETTMEGFESLGSICSGGRYDDLVGGGDERYPGIGLSIGVTRILGPLLARDAVGTSRRSPACVLIAVQSEQTRRVSDEVATSLRRRGIPTEVSPDASKYGRQIRHAERRGIPFVWFPGEAGDEVRDIRSGEQSPADRTSWRPPAGDLGVGVYLRG